jgi:hypothetical protein
MYSVQQRLDGPRGLVARGLDVQLEPDALDLVLVRAVSRQEVQPDPATGLGQPNLRHLALRIAVLSRIRWIIDARSLASDGARSSLKNNQPASSSPSTT